MAKQSRTDQPVKKARPPASGLPAQKTPGSLLNRTDAFFDRNLNRWLWISMGLTLLFSLLLFDSKVSLSGDDSFYIKRAYDLIHSFTYPSFQGPLYPAVLSLFVAVFGISMVPLKLLSVISMLAFVYLFFVSFRNRIPSSLLIFSMLLVSINSYILYYASQTYSEAFYMFVQMLLVMVFFKYFIDSEEKATEKKLIARHLVLALCILAAALTRSVGFSALAAVAGYFLLQKQWKNLLYAIVSFGMVFLLFQGLKYMLWGDNVLQFSAQGSSLLNKDYYNPAAGKEDLAGLLKRFYENSNLYLSKHFAGIFGLRDYVPESRVRPVLTLFIYGIVTGALVLTQRKNRYIFFTGLLAGAFSLITFVVLQSKWDQSRLIIPALPLLLLLVFAFIYYSAGKPKLRPGQFLLLLLAVIIFLSSFAVTLQAVKTSRQTPGKYGGLTPDWKNYLKASEWAADNLPASSVVACRKPSISFVYGKGHDFFGIMQLPTYSTAAFLKNWEQSAGKIKVFNYSDFNNKQLDPELFRLLKQNYLALVFTDEKPFFAVQTPDSVAPRFETMITAAGISPVAGYPALKALTANQAADLKIYYPDSLINNLRKNHVTHLLTASLRRNAAVKDGTFINTVERYKAYIEEKYPEIFVKAIQAGDDDNEPATLYSIDYQKYGMKLQ